MVDCNTQLDLVILNSNKSKYALSTASNMDGNTFYEILDDTGYLGNSKEKYTLMYVSFKPPKIKVAQTDFFGNDDDKELFDSLDDKYKHGIGFKNISICCLLNMVNRIEDEDDSLSQYRILQKYKKIKSIDMITHSVCDPISDSVKNKIYRIGIIKY